MFYTNAEWSVSSCTNAFLSQARAGHRLACAWLLEVFRPGSWYTCVYVYVYVCP